MKRDDQKSPRESGRQPGPGRHLLGVQDNPGNTMVLATIAAVIVSTLIGIGALSPLLFAAAVFPFYFNAMRRGDHRSGVYLVFRWGVALFATLVVVGAFVPGRLGAALPLSDAAVRTIEAWVRSPAASPPAGTGYLFWGMLAFLAGSLASGGLLGFVIGAIAVGGAAYGALFVFRHGFNIIQIAFVALPVWQLALFIACAFLLAPASVFVFERFLHAEKRSEERARLRLFMYAGAGFFVLSVLLRFAVAPSWRALLERWTVI